MHTVDAFRAAFAAFGAPPARPEEVAEAHALAARLIGGKVATRATLARVHARTDAGVFVVRENGAITGMNAYVLLSERGVGAIWTDRFNALDPALGHIVLPGDEPAGVYGWGIAASNHPAAQQMMKGYDVVRHQVIGHLPYFGRAATADGRRLMLDKLGFRLLPGTKTGMLWIEPLVQHQSEAAAA